jgi:type III pantothenate kinase
METAERYKDIINAYADPARHGVDRWAGLVAAHELFSEVPLCVIGAGTALTFDLLKADGEHLGGYIVPSYASMHQILLGATADIISQPTAHFGNEKIPDNTDDAVNSGLHILLQAGVREMCVSAKNALGEDMKLVITGGAAPTILAYPQMPEMSHQPDLVMQGLYRVMSQPESAVQNKAEI